MKTLSLRKEDATHDWFIVDASDKILGRLATKIADRIRGKDKPTFTPHTDGGDYVIVINADKIKVTGNKKNQKKKKPFLQCQIGAVSTIVTSGRDPTL